MSSTSLLSSANTFCKMATLIAPARAALLPRTARGSARASRNIKTSATTKKQAGSSESQVPVQKQEGQQQPAVTRSPTWVSGSMLPRMTPASGLLPAASDFGMLAPTFGRVGGFLRSIEQEMNNALQTLATDAPGLMEGGDMLAPLHVDIEDKEKEIVIAADVPGLTGHDIHVAFDPEARLLTLSGERKEEVKQEEEGGFVRMERRFGRFERRFRMPANVDGDAITAKVAHGVLKVHVPKSKTAESKEKSIRVETHQ